MTESETDPSAKSLDDLRARAEAGESEAQHKLGRAYADGTSVPQDAAEAMRWYRLAAEQGDAEAQFHLGFGYADGTGVPQDDAEAVRRYRLAADQGFADAQFNLGLAYVGGCGVTADSVQAHMWLNLAASRQTGEDRESAVTARNQLAGRMTPDQLAEAQRLAREWAVDLAHAASPMRAASSSCPIRAAQRYCTGT